MNVPDRLKSRKLWITIGTAAVAVANAAFDWGIPNEVGVALALVIVAYLGGQSAIDTIEVRESIKASADFEKQQAIAIANNLAEQLRAAQELAEGE